MSTYQSDDYALKEQKTGSICPEVNSLISNATKRSFLLPLNTSDPSLSNGGEKVSLSAKFTKTNYVPLLPQRHFPSNAIGNEENVRSQWKFGIKPTPACDFGQSYDSAQSSSLLSKVDVDDDLDTSVLASQRSWLGEKMDLTDTGDLDGYMHGESHHSSVKRGIQGMEVNSAKNMHVKPHPNGMESHVSCRENLTSASNPACADTAYLTSLSNAEPVTTHQCKQLTQEEMATDENSSLPSQSSSLQTSYVVSDPAVSSLDSARAAGYPVITSLGEITPRTNASFITNTSSGTNELVSTVKEHDDSFADAFVSASKEEDAKSKSTAKMSLLSNEHVHQKDGSETESKDGRYVYWKDFAQFANKRKENAEASTSNVSNRYEKILQEFEKLQIEMAQENLAQHVDVAKAVAILRKARQNILKSGSTLSADKSKITSTNRANRSNLEEKGPGSTVFNGKNSASSQNAFHLTDSASPGVTNEIIEKQSSINTSKTSLVAEVKVFNGAVFDGKNNAVDQNVYHFPDSADPSGKNQTIQKQSSKSISQATSVAACQSVDSNNTFVQNASTINQLTKETHTINQLTKETQSETSAKRSLFPVSDTKEPEGLLEQSFSYETFSNNVNITSCHSTPSRSSWQINSKKDMSVDRNYSEQDARESEKKPTGFVILDDKTPPNKLAKKKEQFLLGRLKKEEQIRRNQMEREMEAEKRKMEAKEQQEKLLQKKQEEKAKRDKIFKDYQKRKRKEEAAALSSPGVIGTPSSTVKKATNQKHHSHFIDHLHNHDVSHTAGSSNLTVPVSSRTYLGRGQPPHRNEDDTDSLESGSSNDYSGPKLYKQLRSKSNRLLITNAINHCCLSGKVNDKIRNKTLNALEESDARHLMVLFRDNNCQFRALYKYNPEEEKLHKISGSGPGLIVPSMIEALFKYNSGRRAFTCVPSKTLAVSIDGITIKNSIWQHASSRK